MQTTNFYMSFSKNILLYMSSRLSKIRSVHTYVMPRTVYFGGICILYLVRFFYWFFSEAINKRLVNFGCYWHFSSHMPCFSPLATIIDHKPRAGTKTLLQTFSRIAIHNIYQSRVYRLFPLIYFFLDLAYGQHLIIYF